MLPTGTGGCRIVDAIRGGEERGTIFPCAQHTRERAADNETMICRPSPIIAALSPGEGCDRICPSKNNLCILRVYQGGYEEIVAGVSDRQVCTSSKNVTERRGCRCFCI